MNSKMLKSTLFSLMGLFVLSVFFVSQASAKQYMPEWELKTVDGDVVKSADLLGSPVIVHFWATWCPYCKRIHPTLDALYKKHQSKGLKFVAISYNEDDDAEPQKVIDERGLSFKTLVNGDDVAIKKFGVKGTPTTYFFNSDGSLLNVTKASKPNDPIFEEAVQMLYRMEKKIAKKLAKKKAKELAKSE